MESRARSPLRLASVTRNVAVLLRGPMRVPSSGWVPFWDVALPRGPQHHPGRALVRFQFGASTDKDAMNGYGQACLAWVNAEGGHPFVSSTMGPVYMDVELAW